MKKISKVKNILKFNLKPLIGFEIIYKLSTSIIFIPLFLSIFKLITKVSGYTYLTFENIFNFLLNPLTLIFLLFLILIMTFYTIIDISTIIIILDSSYAQKKITIKEAFILSLKKSIQVFKPQNILLSFLIMFLIPFLHLGISSSFISTISIPEFILDFIMNNNFLLAIYIILVILLCYLLFKWLYAIHYYVLEDCDFKEARKKSTNLSKKNKFKDFLSIVITELIISAIYFLFIFLGIVLILILTKVFSKTNLFSNLSITIIWLLIALSFVVLTLLTTPICYAIISVLYYQHKQKNNEEIKHLKINAKEIKQATKKFNILKYSVCFLILVSSLLFTYSLLNGKYNFNIEYLRTMEVTAHRGASKLYPENTMAAFVGAKQLNADWIELDVQQTKDEKLIVLHDTNFKRTTGVNKNSWQTTYEEVEKLDAGSFFSSEFKGEKIPLLEEVLDFAKKNNIKLNIELKPTGHEKNFEASVGELINKYDFASNCVITSQVYEVLENVKAYDPNLKTVYVMSLAYGDITSLKAADNFSIEASSVTKPLVNKVHNAGKELYAWTVNTESSINDMIELNVDNIITDNISLAKDTIYSSKTSNIIQEYVKFINNLLK